MSDNTTLDLTVIEQCIDDVTKYQPLPWKWHEWGMVDAEGQFIISADPLMGDCAAGADTKMQEFIVAAPDTIRALVAAVRNLNGYVADADRIIAAMCATLAAVKRAVDENRWTDAKRLLEGKD